MYENWSSYPKNNMKKTTYSLLALAMTLTGGVQLSQAADPGELALKYADNLQANRKKLANYSWQQRLEVTKNGKQQSLVLLSARFDSAGNLQTTEINKDLKIRTRHGLIGGALQESTQDNIAAKVKNMKAWAMAYVYMSRGTVVDFFDGATVADVQGWDNAVVVRKANVLSPGDSVSLIADKDSLMPHRLSFVVPTDDKKGVACTISFRYLRDNGAFVAGSASGVWAGGNDITVHVENFDFIKQL